MAIMVTGGAGFIGANYIRYLFDTYGQDVEVVNVDCLTYAGNLLNLESVDQLDQYHFAKVDISDRGALDAIFNQYSITEIVHFAAESHVDRSIMDGSVFVKTNVLGTENLLSLAKEHRVERFVHVSTDEVYGALGEDGLFTEQSPLEPTSPYSASKTASDLLALSYYRTYGLHVSVTRCSNNYGPYQFPEKLIPLMVANALDDRPLPVYGTGQNVRDWIFVTDHCRAVDRVRSVGQAGEVYNFGGQSEMRNLDVVKTILNLLNKPESLIEFVQDRLGHDFRYAIDFSKAQRELDWVPTVTFEEGLRQTVDWYVTHTSWLDAVRDGSYRDYYRTQYSKGIPS